MNVIVKQELKMNAKSLLYWVIGMVLLIAIAIAEYSTVVDATSENSMMPMLMAMPRIIRVMFGMDAIPIDTPMGYYTCMLIWFEFVAFFHAAFMGAGILAKEERDRTADYLFTKPYSRSTVITGKVVASVINLIVVNAITWGISAVAFGNPKDFDSIQREIALLMIGMLLMQFVFFALALLISSTVKRPKTASSLAVGSVLLAYLLGVMIEYEDIARFDFLSFFRYFHAKGIYEDGIRVAYILLSLVLVGGFLSIAYRFYNRRDLQV